MTSTTSAKASWVTLSLFVITLPIYAGVLGGIAGAFAMILTLETSGMLAAILAVPAGMVVTFVVGGPLIGLAWLLIHVFTERTPLRFAQALALLGGGFALFWTIWMLRVFESSSLLPLIVMLPAGALIGWHIGKVFASAYKAPEPGDT